MKLSGSDEDAGGSTILYNAHFPRFHPSDFRTNTLDGVADDLPVTYEELEPYYDVNDRIMGVAGTAGDPAHPPKSPRQTRPLFLGKPGAYVLGFTCGNDGSARDWQASDPTFWRAKASETFSPIGPHIVTGLDPSNVIIKARVNGEGSNTVAAAT